MKDICLEITLENAILRLHISWPEKSEAKLTSSWSTSRVYNSLPNFICRGIMNTKGQLWKLLYKKVCLKLKYCKHFHKLHQANISIVQTSAKSQGWAIVSAWIEKKVWKKVVFKSRIYWVYIASNNTPTTGRVI